MLLMRSSKQGLLSQIRLSFVTGHHFSKSLSEIMLFFDRAFSA
jgi:hypothetical protein